MPSVTDQIRERIKALKTLERLGIDPFPYVCFDPVPCRTIKDNYEKWEGKPVEVAGRMVARRIMGKVTFIDLEDDSGRIQIYVSRDSICSGEDKTFYNTVVKKLLDLGDYLRVSGTVFKTKTGEISVNASTIQLLAKALRPPPIAKRKGEVAFSELKDPEVRYRQRYLDLLVHPEVRNLFRVRTRIINAIRKFLDAHGFLEVETPVLHPVYGGAHARPFKTHHNALDIDLYLRISNELYLKRLLIGGYERVYEFSRDFRNEGVDKTHNPEFTMLELYVAYKDYIWMAEFTEKMLVEAVRSVHGKYRITSGDITIDFTPPWQKLTFFGALKEATGIDLRSATDSTLEELAEKTEISIERGITRGKLLEKLFGRLVEKELINPTFIFDFPRDISPLAKAHRNDPELAERFEVICRGMELANAYTEQNIPYEQRKQFLVQQELRKKGEEEAMPMDEDFIVAMEYGMPPMAGLGIGIDRLVMILTGAKSIQEVLLFPLVRPVPVKSYAAPVPYDMLEEGD